MDGLFIFRKHRMRNYEVRTYSIREVGRLLGIGRDSAYKSVKSGAIRSIRFGAVVRVPHIEVERILKGEHSRLTI
jgi:excisionase family DNA binding protein